jgi:hypothetical protein
MKSSGSQYDTVDLDAEDMPKSAQRGSSDRRQTLFLSHLSTDPEWMVIVLHT